MQEQDATPVTENKEEAPKLSRQQQRLIDRVEHEAKTYHEILADKFFQFFALSDNPEGEEVQAKIRQLNAQWVVFCNKKRLKPEVKTFIKTFCDNLIQEYKDTRDGQVAIDAGSALVNTADLVTQES
jgi:hypothetical protein